MRHDHRLLDRITFIEDKISSLKEEREKLLNELKRICTHELVSEAPYRGETTFSYAEAPFRVCETCGLLEKGWGAGYKILTTDRTRKISRDEGYDIRNKKT